jgi:hypothetical protein
LSSGYEINSIVSKSQRRINMPKKAAGSMDVDSMIKGLIADLDAQISELAKKRNALANAFGESSAPVAAAPAAAAASGIRRRGRPPGSGNKKGKKAAAPVVAASAADKPAKKGKKKRVFSEETKKKLAAKAKARWARIRAEQGQE